MVGEPIWLEPYPGGASSGDPAAKYDALEAVELAFVAALQHLPARQRAVLILHEVLAFSAAEVAAVLDTSVAAVNSALQRARSGLARKVLAPTQNEQLRRLGEPGRRRLVEQFVSAWERSDVPALLDLLVEDARLSMPPLPAWFDGRESVGRFMSERMFATSWKLIPTEANGQLAFGCYQSGSDGAPYRLGSVIVVTIEGDRIAEITAFLDPRVHELFGLPAEFPDDFR
jgi:RNA polymerase sigma-70 factor (ECF subfamily)